MAMRGEAETGGKLTGRHVLLMLLGFFGVLFAVNAVFVIAAVRSFPGETVSGAYSQGLAYNERLDARAAQRALGWRAELGLVERAGSPHVMARLFDAQGQGLDQLDVTVTLRPAAGRAADRSLALENRGRGDYLQSLDGLKSGVWEARLEARDPRDKTRKMDARKRLIVE